MRYLVMSSVFPEGLLVITLDGEYPKKAEEIYLGLLKPDEKR